MYPNDRQDKYRNTGPVWITLTLITALVLLALVRVHLS